jgi:hypothetical protein
MSKVNGSSFSSGLIVPCSQTSLLGAFYSRWWIGYQLPKAQGSDLCTYLGAQPQDATDLV